MYKSEAMSLRGLFFLCSQKVARKVFSTRLLWICFLAGDGFVTGSVLLLITYTHKLVLPIIHKNESNRLFSLSQCFFHFRKQKKRVFLVSLFDFPSRLHVPDSK